MRCLRIVFGIWNEGGLERSILHAWEYLCAWSLQGGMNTFSCRYIPLSSPIHLHLYNIPTIRTRGQRRTQTATLVELVRRPSSIAKKSPQSVQGR